MKIKELINEMGKELLPSLSSKEDLDLLKQLRDLYKKDLVEFEKKLDRINLVRKAENLEPIHKNEIIGKSLKTDIKTVVKSETRNNKKQQILSSKLSGIIYLSKNHLYVGNPEERTENDNYIEFYIKGEKAKIILEFNGKFLHPLDDLKKIKVESPTQYKIIDKEIRFPEISKKIIMRDIVGERGWYSIKFIVRNL